MNKRHEAGDAEQGQSLITILLMSGVLALLGFAMVAMLRYEMQLVAKNKVRDASFAAGDAALQRAMDQLLTRDAAGSYTMWGSGLTGTPMPVVGYSSITGGAGYAEVPGQIYKINILKGDRYPCSTCTAENDAALAAWPNRGDYALDRTIVVAVTHTATAKQDRFYTVIHRNPAPIYPFGGDAVATSGNQELGNWDGDIYDSCKGAYGASGGGGGQSFPDPSEGSLAAGGTIGGGDGDFGSMGQSPNSQPNFPPLVVPAGATVIGSPNVTSNLTIGPVSPTAEAGKDYKTNALNLGNSTLTVDISGGPIRLWVTGTMNSGSKTFAVDIGGSGGINIINVNPFNCCVGKGFTLYVTSADSETCGTCNDCLVQFAGTSGASFLVVAPLATFAIDGGGGSLFKGGIVARQVCFPNGGGSSVFAYDKCLKNNLQIDAYRKPPIITTSWKQVLRDK